MVGGGGNTQLPSLVVATIGFVYKVPGLGWLKYDVFDAVKSVHPV